MLSKKKWLDEYNKVIACYNTSHCIRPCIGCVYNTKHTPSDLLYEAAKIFMAQTLADEVIDDGK